MRKLSRLTEGDETFRNTYLCRQLDNFTPEPRHTGVYAQGMSALFRKCPGLKVLVETQTCCQGTNDWKMENFVQFQNAIYNERWSRWHDQWEFALFWHKKRRIPGPICLNTLKVDERNTSTFPIDGSIMIDHDWSDWTVSFEEFADFLLGPVSPWWPIRHQRRDCKKKRDV